MRTEEEARRLDELPDLEAEREVDFGSLARRIASRWWIVLAAVVIGGAVGFLVSLGGGKVYSATATVYLGNPLSPTGGGSIQGLSTNPATVNQIIHAESTVKDVAARAGMPVVKLRNGISSKVAATGTSGNTAKNTTATQLVEISVQGPSRDATAKAANDLAKIVVVRTSGYVTKKIEILRKQLQSDTRQLQAIGAQINAFDAALKGSKLSPLERLTLVTQESLAEQRRGQLLDEQTQTQQLLQLAQQVERSQVVTPAAAERVGARSRRSSVLVGAVVGLFLGAAAAALWRRPRLRSA